jgi:uncharacterized protein YjbK
MKLVLEQKILFNYLKNKVNLSHSFFLVVFNTIQDNCSILKQLLVLVNNMYIDFFDFEIRISVSLFRDV